MQPSEQGKAEKANAEAITAEATKVQELSRRCNKQQLEQEVKKSRNSRRC
jgi:hypothetical protein